ncbi:MetQ/NlpA family ABC transporter substrate-binding protein, partial [Pandoraea pneumonica]
MQRRTIFKLLAGVGAATVFATQFLAPAVAADAINLKVGVTGGPHAQIFDEVKKVA